MKRRRPLDSEGKVLPDLPEVNATADWIKVVRTSADQVVGILDEVAADKSIYWNRAKIIKAYADGRLYVITDQRLEAEDTREIFRAHGANFVIGRNLTIPAFAIVKEQTEADDEPTIDTIWVRKDWRHFGYGRALVDALKCSTVLATPTSFPFFCAIGFESVQERSLLMKRKVEV